MHQDYYARQYGRLRAAIGIALAATDLHPGHAALARRALRNVLARCDADDAAAAAASSVDDNPYAIIAAELDYVLRTAALTEDQRESLEFAQRTANTALDALYGGMRRAA